MQAEKEQEGASTRREAPPRDDQSIADAQNARTSTTPHQWLEYG